MKHYAATLRGENPSCISTVYQFDSESELKVWIEEKEVEGTYPRVQLSSRLAKIVVKCPLRKVKVKFLYKVVDEIRWLYKSLQGYRWKE